MLGLLIAIILIAAIWSWVFWLPSCDVTDTRWIDFLTAPVGSLKNQAITQKMKYCQHKTGWAPPAMH